MPMNGNLMQPFLKIWQKVMAHQIYINLLVELINNRYILSLGFQNSVHGLQSLFSLFANKGTFIFFFFFGCGESSGKNYWIKDKDDIDCTDWLSQCSCPKSKILVTWIILITPQTSKLQMAHKKLAEQEQQIVEIETTQ